MNDAERQQAPDSICLLYTSSWILVGTTHKLRERLIQLQAAQTRGAERAIPEGASSRRAARQ